MPSTLCLGPGPCDCRLCRSVPRDPKPLPAPLGPYRAAAEMPPPDPPEPRVIPPMDQAEKLNLYATIAWVFCLFIHALAGIAIALGSHTVPWQQIGQICIWGWWGQRSFGEWRKLRRKRLGV